MSAWKRFEEGVDPQDSYQAPSGCQWAVMWDGDPIIYFCNRPENFGGSGWYADPADLIVDAPPY